jgi:hypothetical protein
VKYFDLMEVQALAHPRAFGNDHPLRSGNDVRQRRVYGMPKRAVSVEEQLLDFA